MKITSNVPFKSDELAHKLAEYICQYDFLGNVPSKSYYEEDWGKDRFFVKAKNVSINGINCLVDFEVNYDYHATDTLSITEIEFSDLIIYPTNDNYEIHLSQEEEIELFAAMLPLVNELAAVAEKEYYLS
jgi:hypothetical protein